MKDFFQKHRKAIVFYGFIATLFLGLCSYFLLAQGMFFDGVTYAAIGKNMALGKGTLWEPYYTATLYPQFYEHPPLVFWIESVAYKIFGTSLLVERFYSAGCFLIIGILMLAIWKLRAKEVKTAWFLLFLYFCTPVITWAIPNNLLDSTMSVFVCLSVYFYFKSVVSKKHFLFLVLSGFSIFLGALSKGPVAFFPFCLPFLLWIIQREISWKRFLIDTFFIVLFALLPIALLFLFSPEAKDSLTQYFVQQVSASLAGERATVDNRFHLLQVLFSELMISIIIVLVVFIFSRIKKVHKQVGKTTIWQKESVLFLLLAFAGSLPIMLSTKQRGMYLIPSIPFYTMALVFIVKPYVEFFYNKIRTTSLGFKIFQIFVLVAFVGLSVFTISRNGTIARDKKAINIITECSGAIPNGSTISISTDLWEDWRLHAYFIRWNDVSLDVKNQDHVYFLCKTENVSSLNISSYQKIKEVEDLTLFKKIE